MNRVVGLDLSGLEQFRASSLLDSDASPGGKPQEVDLDLIEFDPDQPRRSLCEASLQELAASIKAYGVLEAVSLRSHPDRAGRFIVNRGERRVRACRLAGKAAVPAWIDERIDRYAQVVENLQREDLTPFDLARFVAEREKAGDSRAVIAARLHKPRSFVTQIAGLAEASEDVRAVYSSGRSRDSRVLYQLARAQRGNPEAVAQLLDGDAPVTRADADALAARKSSSAQSSEPRVVCSSRKADALLIEHEGRRGRLGWSGWPGRRTGEVRFEDGTRRTLELVELKVLAWTAR